MSAPPHDDPRREFARALFGRPETPEPPRPMASAHVPHEGNAPTRPLAHDSDLREFVHDLFDRAWLG